MMYTGVEPDLPPPASETPFFNNMTVVQFVIFTVAAAVMIGIIQYLRIKRYFIYSCLDK